jgi:putative spermidine/putrescine transport system ATP-binding protein
VTLSIGSGEFFAMLGPSGSGKTTCLRLIAGFEAPDAGRILLNGQDVTRSPPYERDVNTVFQDYALFPHLSVLDNVAYGPRVRGVRESERHARARELLALVKLSEMAARRPSQLSGGQRQRVALARALVNKPRVLLLDEPLGALDLKLREDMQLELKSLQRQLGITFVFVTHDQGEALSMADRVAIFNHGRIEQLATPRELYTRPQTSFVARFVGSANVVSGALAQRLSGSTQSFAVRAEHISVAAAGTVTPAEAVSCEATVLDVLYHGASSRMQVKLDDGSLFAVAIDDQRPTPSVNARIWLWWQRDSIVPLHDTGSPA